MTAMSSALDTVTSYEGNLSEKELNYANMIELFGPTGMAAAEAVKFKAPRADWTLKNVTVFGWDGFNGSSESVPSQGIIALEIRDKDLNLLYRFADTQLPYTNFIFNFTGIFPIMIEMPSIPVSDEFYVCFYDRGSVLTSFEFVNETKESYIFDRAARKMLPAELPVGENSTAPINWIMRVNGV
jgi:hypothetical protein